MRNQGGRVLTIVLAAVTAAAAVEGFALVRLSRRVADLEARAPAAAPAVPSPPPAGWREALESDQTAMKQDVREAVRRLDRLEAATAGSPAPSFTAPAGLEETVAKIVDEKVAKLPQGGGGEWKPTLDELRGKLEMSDAQETSAKRILDDAKHEMFLLASLKRPDGSAKIDELVAAVTDPVDPPGAMQKWFISLFSEKIPGRDEPYIAEILRIRDRTERELSATLDAAQAARLKQLHVDYLGVQTGYDPFAEYVQDALR